MDLNSYIDHTVIRPDATEADVRRICEEAAEMHFASVAINLCWVSLARELLEGTGVGITGTVGFPFGATTTEAKAAETRIAVAEGATEIDMVINIGKLKDGDDDYVTRDVAVVVEAAGDIPVKVILETCLLTDEEKVRACKDCVAAGAAFVKTSTGLQSGGATVEDVRLMRATVGDACKVKAAGGIRTRQEALAMIEAGAERIGTSAGLSICS